jgi:hypothetical protein
MVLVAAPARAAGPDLHLDIDVHAIEAAGNFDGRLLDDTPAFHRADLRLRGSGSFTGGGLRMAGVSEKHLRIGWGASFFVTSGVELGHAPLGPDLRLDADRPWGAQVEFFGGWALPFGRFTPYLDLRVGAQFTRTSITVRSAQLGEVQTMSRPFITPLLAPRLGVKILLAKPVSLDLAGSMSPIGIERASIYAGLTFSIGDP